MRCRACNKVLTDYEATRKSATTGEYVDMCNHCFHNVESDIYSLTREDLNNELDLEQDEDIILDGVEDLLYKPDHDYD